jgi:hypothetical protein
MSEGYGADPEVLQQAAKGINQTIEELQAVGQVGGGAVGFGFDSLALSPLQMGHAGLAKAFATFAERWEWGVKALVDEGNEIAEKLDLSAGYYHEAEEYGVGVHLRAPEGTPGLWVEKLSHYGANERELLLGHGNKYTITEAFEDANGQWQIYGKIHQ